MVVNIQFMTIDDLSLDNYSKYTLPTESMKNEFYYIAMFYKIISLPLYIC